MQHHFEKVRVIKPISTFPGSLILRLNVLPAICLMFLILLPGCKKDFTFDKVKSLTWQPELAIPLVNDSITLRKVLTKSGNEDHFYIDETGNISILYYYKNDAFRISPNDLISISPASFSFLHQVTLAEQEILGVADLTLPPVDFPVSLSGNIPGTRVDKLLVKEGIIRVNTDHTFSNNGSFNVAILNATKNGLPFSFTITPFSEGQANTEIDISGVYLDLSASPDVMHATVSALLKKSGEPVAGDEIRADLQVSIKSIAKFEGFLGQQSISHKEDTVKVDIFNKAYIQGDVYFVDPQVTISIVNSIGIPTEITVRQLVAVNMASGSSLDIADRLGAGAVFHVPSPAINATEPTVTSMDYTNENTGNAMTDMFDLKPDKVAFQISTLINPTGTPLNFFNDSSSSFADLKVKLPLYGHFDNLTYQDTFDLTFDRPEDIERLEFRTNIQNGLPLTALMQVYFVDAYYGRIDSLTGDDRIFIREAPVDPATHLPYPGAYGVKDTSFILNTQRMQNFKYVKKMIVNSVLHSAEGGQIYVKLMADQMVKLNFSARASLRRTIQPGK